MTDSFFIPLIVLTVFALLGSAWFLVFGDGISHRKQRGTDATAKRPQAPTQQPAANKPVDPAAAPPSKEDAPEEQSAIAIRQAVLFRFSESEADFLSKILHSRNLIVHQTSEQSDLSALALEAKQLPTLVFFNRDGQEEIPSFAKKLRRPRESGLHIVALTSRSQSAHIQRELRSGSYDFALARPAKASELFRLLDTLAKRRYPSKDFKHSKNGA